ncbi:MAG: DUF58 domain-containing protein [Chloroflexi bacterium]|nr:DUF58 domain-containing protein [Chloroflexota bacterium]
MPTSPPLFDETTRRKLEQLTLMASRVRSGAIKGERRSTKRGTSIEFADYRDYAPGDDLRRVDWNVYARLDRPLTKLFEDEEDLAVHLILDASASMDFPPREGEGADPAAHKFDYARRLIAGLASIALTTNDRLTISALGSTGAHFGPARGRAYGGRLLQFVNEVRAGGQVDLNIALKTYATQARRPGLCLIASDLFSPAGILDGLNALVGRGYEVGVLHILCPEEVEPPLSGDLRLMDSESGDFQEVTVDGAMRDLYMRRLEDWRETLRNDCQKRGAHFVSIVTSTPWEKIILYDLRRLGLVR